MPPGVAVKSTQEKEKQRPETEVEGVGGLGKPNLQLPQCLGTAPVQQLLFS